MRIGVIADYMQSRINAIEHYNEQLIFQNLNAVDTRRLTYIGTYRAYASACLRNHPMINSNLSFLHAPKGFRFTEADIANFFEKIVLTLTGFFIYSDITIWRM